MEEIPEGHGGQIRNVSALVTRLRSRGYVVALDERGDARRSLAFADWLERRMSTGDLVFVIGGALGLPEEVLAVADVRLSLSEMTLPHELARLLSIIPDYHSMR